MKWYPIDVLIWAVCFLQAGIVYELWPAAHKIVMKLNTLFCQSWKKAKKKKHKICLMRVFWCINKTNFFVLSFISAQSKTICTVSFQITIYSSIFVFGFSFHFRICRCLCASVFLSFSLLFIFFQFFSLCLFLCFEVLCWRFSLLLCGARNRRATKRKISTFQACSVCMCCNTHSTKFIMKINFKPNRIHWQTKNNKENNKTTLTKRARLMNELCEIVILFCWCCCRRRLFSFSLYRFGVSLLICRRD